jgi:hypothetical protein
MLVFEPLQAAWRDVVFDPGVCGFSPGFSRERVLHPVPLIQSQLSGHLDAC